MMIRKCEKRDINQIVDIVNKVHIDKVKDKTRGFLISTYNKEDYLNFLNKTEYFYVLEENNKILAFMLGGYNNISEEIIDTKPVINEIDKGQYFYIKQICVDIDVDKKGIGSYFYKELFKLLNLKKIYLSIVTKPYYNESSIIFHEKNGFKKVKDYKKKKFELSLWLRNDHKEGS